jgi:uncharacterized protein YjbI with pentapeptide repeats
VAPQKEQCGPTPPPFHLELTFDQARAEGSGEQCPDLASHHLTLEGATLSDAHLENAYLIGADLEKAALGGAYLHGAKLDLADLTGAGPIGTHLEGVDLSKVLGLTVEQLETARLDRATKLPDGMV